jgi:hypothetical protein
MKYLMACALTAVVATAGCAGAQDASPPRAQSTPSCPADGRDMPVDALYGQWEARFEGVPGFAKVALSRHPEYAGVRGTVAREGVGAPNTVAQLAGDIGDDGLLSIDESSDGHSISGVWTAELQVGSCGRTFKGTWRNATDDSTHPFVLNKTGSRQ